MCCVYQGSEQDGRDILRWGRDGGRHWEYLGLQLMYLFGGQPQGSRQKASGQRPRGVCAFIKCPSLVSPFLAIGHRRSNLQHNANCIVVELLYNWCNVAGKTMEEDVEMGASRPGLRTMGSGPRTLDSGLRAFDVSVQGHCNGACVRVNKLK